MRAIVKIKEPTDFVEHRAKPNSTFDNIPTDVKNNLRKTLLKSQGYICCYCMKRISFSASKIEHFKSQKHNNGQNGSTDLTLDYNNLYVACVDSGGKYENQTCDSHKKEIDLQSIDISSIQCNSMFKYDGNGTILSSTGDCNVNDEINDVLNLNQQTLKDNRKSIYDGLKNRFRQQYKKGKFNMAYLKKELAHWSSLDSNGFYPEYCMVAVYLINRQISKMQK